MTPGASRASFNTVSTLVFHPVLADFRASASVGTFVPQKLSSSCPCPNITSSPLISLIVVQAS